jgi:hypothetical protein
MSRPDIAPEPPRQGQVVKRPDSVDDDRCGPGQKGGIVAGAVAVGDDVGPGGSKIDETTAPLASGSQCLVWFKAEFGEQGDLPRKRAGWMFFVYQDDHVSETFHYHSTAVTPDVRLAFTIVTDTTSQAFPYGSPPPFPQAGSQTTAPGRTFAGTYRSEELTLPYCGSYLYWANPSNTSKTSSCSFSYSGTTTW